MGQHHSDGQNHQTETGQQSVIGRVPADDQMQRHDHRNTVGEGTHDRIMQTAQREQTVFLEGLKFRIGEVQLNGIGGGYDCSQDHEPDQKAYESGIVHL